MQSPLSNAITIHNEIKRRIAEAYNLDDDDPALIDTLDGESDLKEMIAKILWEAEEVDAQVVAINALQTKLDSRIERLVNRKNRLRDTAKWAMQEADIKKIEAPHLTASLRAGTQGVQITNADDLPDDLCTIKVDRKPNKAAIKEALKSGTSLSCAYLTNPEPVLMVRSQ